MANRYLQTIQSHEIWGHYSIVFGLLAAELHIDKIDALTGFLYNAAAGFVIYCVKLIPLGQQDVQEMQMSVFPLIIELAETCLESNENKFCLFCPAFNIRCMQHKQLYSRLYMS